MGSLRPNTNVLPSLSRKQPSVLFTTAPFLAGSQCIGLHEEREGGRDPEGLVGTT